MIPKQYRCIAVVLQDTPYQTNDSQSLGAQPSAGILQIGRVVWTEHHPRSAVPNGRIPAYLDGVGVVTLDPACLTSIR